MKRSLFICLMYFLCSTGVYAMPKEEESKLPGDSNNPEEHTQLSQVEGSESHGEEMDLRKGRMAVESYLGALTDLFGANSSTCSRCSFGDLTYFFRKGVWAREEYVKYSTIVPPGLWKEWNDKAGASKMLNFDAFMENKGEGCRDFFKLITLSEKFIRGLVESGMEGDPSIYNIYDHCPFPFREFFSSVLTDREGCIKRFMGMFAVAKEFTDPHWKNSIGSAHPLKNVLDRLEKEDVELLTYDCCDPYMTPFGKLFLRMEEILGGLQDPKNIISIVPRVVKNTEFVQYDIAEKQIKDFIKKGWEAEAELYKQCSQLVMPCYLALTSLTKEKNGTLFKALLQETRQNIQITETQLRDECNNYIESVYDLLEKVPTSGMIYIILDKIIYEGRITFIEMEGPKKHVELRWRLAREILQKPDESEEMAFFLKSIRQYDGQENSKKMHSFMKETLEGLRSKASGLDPLEERVCNLTAMYCLSTAIPIGFPEKTSKRFDFFSVALWKEMDERVMEIVSRFLDNINGNLNKFRANPQHPELSREERIMLRCFDMVTSCKEDSVPFFVMDARYPFRPGFLWVDDDMREDLEKKRCVPSHVDGEEK